ncbi:hypothetical protein F5Y14DRAFT_441429 [Nemania sp. NC0429]|nr:hypothetical protein F5Y14DRAFT_441429 [Nemania sp. NC0429]
MPKRSYGSFDDMSSGLKIAPVKTERSHEENQERAYIAASRRADRSLEARVQSAKMASDIHRKRTGRGLKVSEEIVLREEMYEEMEDDMPRPYRYLAAHLHTNSPELNHRVSAYVASQTAMATMAKYNEINRRFSEAFPQAANFSQPAQNSHYMSPLVNRRFSSPALPESARPPTSRHPSISAQSHSSNTDGLVPDTSSGQTPSTVSVATPDLSPDSTSTDAVESASTPYGVPQSAFPSLPLDPRLAQQSTSSFTAELTGDVKMLANVDMGDPMAMHFFGNSTPSEFTMPSEFNESVICQPQIDSCDLEGYDCPKPSDEYYDGFDASNNFQGLLASDSLSQLGTPGYGGLGTDSWESFVDFGTEQ